MYLLEIAVVCIGIFLSVGAYFVGKYVLRIPPAELTYVSIAVSGFLFVLGHVYSRLKDRRDGKRKRAQELFLEWHSKDIRDSRIFVSRWIEAKGESNLQALRTLENLATRAYIDGEGRPNTSIDKHPLDDPEAKEFHFFTIYQFFERWAALIDQYDIDKDLANRYMSSYKPWYLSTFVNHWYRLENDQWIKASLRNILLKVFAVRVDT
ncbi:hypothetical protein ACO0K3_16930 [Undibacterium sp. Rencai35W]|uniref:hypothetical protein n=1 Tax=Undibacterium sp. Rencai35W TaxID=3413046 RepID=UPI003BEFC9A4